MAHSFNEKAARDEQAASQNSQSHGIFTHYANQGFSVLAVPYGKKESITKWKQYQTTIAAPEQMQLWDKQQLNVAIVTGSLSGLWVLDIDGEVGQKTFNTLIAQYGELPPTLTAKSYNGVHYYFRYPTDGSVITNLISESAHGEALTGIDVRGQGGYIIAPPSLHPDGTNYSWVNDVPIIDAPEWLLKLVTQPPKPQGTSNHSKSAGYSNDYCEKALENELAILRSTPEGKRNAQLNISAFNLGQLVAHGLREDRISNALLHVAMAIGLPQAEAMKTIASGLQSGIASPREYNQQKQRNQQQQEVKPLIAKKQYGAEYPLDALPDKIREAVISHQHYCQQPIPLVACSALTQVSIACQPHADVRRDSILVCPLSLYLLTVAESGERKTAADKAFSKAIRDYEKSQLIDFEKEVKAYERLYKTWKAILDGIETGIKKEAARDKSTKELATLKERHEEHMRKEPSLPLSPRIIYEDVNQETLAVSLSKARPFAALISDEGGIVVGGNGMSTEKCLGYFAFLNRLWDGFAAFIRDRLTVESCQLRGRRFTVSLMLQEAVLRKLVAVDHGASRSTGFLARFLLACPNSTMGSRLYREPPQQADRAMNAFNERIAEILALPLPYSGDDDGSLQSPELHLSIDAKNLWVKYFNSVEERISRHAEFASIPDFASKSAENAVRLAGCFHIFCHGISGKIEAETMRRAIAVANWHLQETLLLFETIDTPQEIQDALLLWDWLKLKQPQNITLTYLRNYAPNRLRSGERHKKAVEVLLEHNYLLKDEKREHHLRINPEALKDEK